MIIESVVLKLEDFCTGSIMLDLFYDQTPLRWNANEVSCKGRISSKRVHFLLMISSILRVFVCLSFYSMVRVQ